MYRTLTTAMRDGLIQSAHDCSDGGLSVSLSESCFGTDGGATIDISPLRSHSDDLSIAAILFGESLGRILISVAPEDTKRFESMMDDIACFRLGSVTEEERIMITDSGMMILDAEVSRLRRAWKSTLDGSDQ